MEFWRSEAYMAYFDHLDHHGGFYYEVRFLRDLPIERPNRELCGKQRWGDAPVHTIGAALFQSADRIHYFHDIGYQHYEYQHCPTGDLWKSARCACDPANNYGILIDRSLVAFADWSPSFRLPTRVLRATVGMDRGPIMILDDFPSSPARFPPFPSSAQHLHPRRALCSVALPWTKLMSCYAYIEY